MVLGQLSASKEEVGGSVIAHDDFGKYAPFDDEVKACLFKPFSEIEDLVKDACFFGVIESGEDSLANFSNDSFELNKLTVAR